VICRTLAEIDAAGAALAATWGPPSQALVDRAAALLAPYQPVTTWAASRPSREIRGSRHEKRPSGGPL
jgi:hypothetical protein